MGDHWEEPDLTAGKARAVVRSACVDADILKDLIGDYEAVEAGSQLDARVEVTVLGLRLEQHGRG